MGAFSADWLALREPADALARSTAVVDAIRASGRKKPAPHEPLSIVDLGCGTGANLRYLAPRLGGAQHWQLIDSDRALLAAAREVLTQWGHTVEATVTARGRKIRIVAGGFTCTVETRELDLAGGLGSLALPPASLVTASALLDLVSEKWLDAFVDACRDANASVLFALTYDGRLVLDPAEPDDELARALFNRHQRTDKGFGPALGPDAAAAASAVLASHGYALSTDASDWCLGSDARRLQAELVDGWHAAALEIEPGAKLKLERWHARHRRRIDAGEAEVVVGHVDLAGVLLR